MATLEIKNLTVSVKEKQILKDLNLTIDSSETIALLGPNGNGKSTLLQTIMGNPNYVVESGEILLDGKDILSLEADERSKLGLFLGMQNPSEVPGVNNVDFLKASLNAHREKPISLFEFIKTMEGTISSLQMSSDLAHRFLNEGFSGGEKKRNEIVQLELLKPSLAMLDEIDSGLDVDAIKLVADAINRIHKENNMSMIIVSHYDRFLQLIKPQFTHVLVDGQIVLNGGPELYERIDSEGYDWVYKELNIEKKEEVKPQRVSIGTCAVKDTLKV